MKEKKIESMLDDLNEALQRHIASSKPTPTQPAMQTKSFAALTESGISYIALQLVSQGGDVEVETLFIQSDFQENMQCEVLLDGETVQSHNSPIGITKLNLSAGNHTLEVAAGGNILAGKVSVNGIFSSIDAVS